MNGELLQVEPELRYWAALEYLENVCGEGTWRIVYGGMIWLERASYRNASKARIQDWKDRWTKMFHHGWREKWIETKGSKIVSESFSSESA